MKNRFTLRHAAPLLLAGALITASCSDASSGQASDNTVGGRAGVDSPVTDLSTDEIVLTSGLTTAESCSALLERIKDEAVERVGPYGFDHGGRYGPVVDFALEGDDAMEDEAAESAPATTTSAAVAEGRAATADGSTDTDTDAATSAPGVEGEDFSGTNNQEQGVDEADLVKTDGERLVIASGNTLRVIDVTGTVPRLTTTVELPDDVWAGQMFLDGDRVLLMNSGWTEEPFLERAIDTAWYPGSPVGRLMEIDLDSGDVVRTLEFEGSYLSAREIDGSIRIVLTATADRFAFVYPSNQGAEDSAEKANRDLIEQSTIEQWLPTYRITENGRTVDEGTLVDCDRVHLPTEFAGFGSMVMLTTDMDNGLEVTDALAVFTDAQTMYASTDRVAIATPRWPEFTDDGQWIDEGDVRTALHTFDITDPDRADYVASGLVDGSLLNQFSLSEHNGHLRVATTDGSPWGRESSESFVSVLEEQGNVLKVVGQVGGLGPGERIFSVRFMGDVAYVVTFREVDPLYTVDLSDPTDPVVKGELKIPGFSDYLHPVEGEYLLGVGMDGDEQGFISGAVVSLFDVSDLTNPTRVAKLPLGPKDAENLESFEWGSWTPVSNDAKAFTYFDGHAVVPVGWWGGENEAFGVERNGSDAVVIDVDLDGTLTEVGRIGHPVTGECEVYRDGEWFIEPADAVAVPEEERAPDAIDEELLEETGDAEASFARDDAPPVETTTTAPAPAPAPSGEEERYCWEWQPDIQRSVIIGDDIYTLSDAGVQVNTFTGLDEVTWIPFERR
ncbi:MAG: beta-propeller domain-containing protein [Actinomycetota bacterium]